MLGKGKGTAEDVLSELCRCQRKRRPSVDGQCLGKGVEFSLGIAENRLGLIERDNQVLAYEDIMEDGKKFNKDETMTRLDFFMKNLGCKKNE